MSDIKLCDTCGINERNTTTWYMTLECSECDKLTQEKCDKNGFKKLRKVYKNCYCSMCNVYLKRNENDGILIGVYVCNGVNGNTHYCKQCYETI